MVIGYFCLKYRFHRLVLGRVSSLGKYLLNVIGFWVEFLKQGIKNRTFFVLSTVRGRAAPSHPRIYRVLLGGGEVKVISLP